MAINRRCKTASQIIAEAKASVYQDQGAVTCRKVEPSSQQRLVSTERPFTPRSSDRNLNPIGHGGRSQRPSSSISLHFGAIKEESEDEEAGRKSSLKLAPLKHTKSNNKRESLLTRSLSAGSKLPSIVTLNGPRQQFRRQISYQEDEIERPASSRPKSVLGTSAGGARTSRRSGDHTEFSRLLASLEAAQDDTATAQTIEQLCQWLGLKDNDGLNSSQRRELMPVLSRHLTSDNWHILFPLTDILLLLMKGHQSKTLMVLAAKMVFKLARNDTNDATFLSRPTMELLLTCLGHHCPLLDQEAFVYAYGGLKFLTLNAKITEHLSSLVGFLHLSVLHIKIICEEADPAGLAQVMFQVTSCTRNLCNTRSNCDKFVKELNGCPTLMTVINQFKDDVDVMCNVSRILSVLTATDEAQFLSHCQPSDVVDALYTILSRHHTRRDIVVRVTFVLGNLAARSDEARIAIGQHGDSRTLLPSLLNKYVTELGSGEAQGANDNGHLDEATVDFGSTGNVEDTAIKIIRVFANASIEPETGYLLAMTASIVSGLLDAATIADNYQHILLPTLATLNNLSFYPIINQLDIYERLRGLVLNADAEVAAETARVLGNLSRRREVRQCLQEDGFFKCTAHLLANSVDRDLVYALVGIIINMMSDGEHRPNFRDEHGVEKCIDLLDFCLEAKDWELACLVCQAIWNYCIDSKHLSDVIEPSHLIEIEDGIVYLLEAYNVGLLRDNEETHMGTEFCHVALTLLKRVLDESPRKVELLLAD
jgi:hypothetical protein